MGKVTVKFRGTLRYEKIDRDRVTPENLKEVVTRKILEVLEPEGDTTLSVEATDGY